VTEARVRRPIALVRAALFGCHRGSSTFFLSRWLFVRLLGLVSSIAFVSLWVQIEGLSGSRGIAPAGELLELRLANGASPWQLPTLCWLSSSDAVLRGLCAVGTAFALLLLLDVAPLLALPWLWWLYLSLHTACIPFLNFQWDSLLLETLFFALFVAPAHWRPRLWTDSPPSRLGLWLLRWLLFKLMFLSGVVKLLSGDEAWWGLTALPVHYETQPLPTVVGWYAYHLPEWCHTFSLVAMYAIEIPLPFLVFAPRLPRHLAAGGLILLQVVIALTGNYTFFNLLTASLCVPLLDDALLLAMLRRIPLLRRVAARVQSADVLQRPRRRHLARLLALAPVAAAILALSLLAFSHEMVRTYDNAKRRGNDFRVPRAIGRALEVAREHGVEWAEEHVLAHTQPFATINGYGLFRDLTTERPEIVIEGSHDGRDWKEYPFRWKPGDPQRAPGLVAPHQPRLDWQMWFAALGPQREGWWLERLIERLFEGSPPVLALFESDPFPGEPPQYLRLVYYRYRFTERGTRRETGRWWKRERLGVLGRPFVRGERQ
jgi:hypothetical protein